jgi:hypothetical protein
LLAQQKISGLPLSTLVKLGAIEGVLSDTNHGPLPGFKQEFSAPYYFYRHEKPLQHVFAPKFIHAGSAPDLSFLSRPDLDPYLSVFLSEPLPSEDFPAIPKFYDPQLHYDLLKDECDLQRYNVTLHQFSLVVFCETMFPGWKAFVDGKPERIFTADNLLRSVFMPAGKHEVEFRFEPWWAKPLFFGLMLWSLLTLGFCLRGPFRA